jgi:hypothetical protein
VDFMLLMDHNIKYLKYDGTVGSDVCSDPVSLFPEFSSGATSNIDDGSEPNNLGTARSLNCCHDKRSNDDDDDDDGKLKTEVLFCEISPHLFSMPRTLQLENDVVPWMELFAEQGVYDGGCACEELLSVIRIDKQYQMHVLLCLPVMVGHGLFVPLSTSQQNKRVLFMLFNFEHDASRTLQLIEELSKTQKSGQTKLSQCLTSVKKYLTRVTKCGLVSGDADVEMLLSDMVGPFQQDQVLGLDRGDMNDHLQLLSIESGRNGAHCGLSGHASGTGLFKSFFSNPHSKHLFATPRSYSDDLSTLHSSPTPLHNHSHQFAPLLLTNGETFPATSPWSSSAVSVLQSAPSTEPPLSPLDVPSQPVRQAWGLSPPSCQVTDHPIHGLTQSRPGATVTVNYPSSQCDFEGVMSAVSGARIESVAPTVDFFLPQVHPCGDNDDDEDDNTCDSSDSEDRVIFIGDDRKEGSECSQANDPTSDDNRATCCYPTSLSNDDNEVNMPSRDPSSNPQGYSVPGVSHSSDAARRGPISRRKLQILTDVIGVRNAELAVMDAMLALAALGRKEGTRSRAIAPHGRKLLAQAIQDTDMILRSGSTGGSDCDASGVASSGGCFESGGGLISMRLSNRMKRERMVSVLNQAYNGDFIMTSEQQRAAREFLQQYDPVLNDRERIKEKLQGPDKLAWTLLLFGKGMLAMSELMDGKNRFSGSMNCGNKDTDDHELSSCSNVIKGIL